MIDTLLRHKKMAARLSLLVKWDLQPKSYATLTLHRPSNVDDKGTLQEILEALREISQQIPIIFPMHPRTKKMVQHFGLQGYLSNGNKVKGIWAIEPLGYLEFLHLNIHAKMVLTDSGGLQEETTVLGVPCLTLRGNTERPITCSEGTNAIVGHKRERILAAARAVLNGQWPNGRIPERWDGKAAERIVEHILRLAIKIEGRDK
jgi:UDP-N-acetylglucosamine 2-epimerase (non-hydrolysing)